MILYFSAAGNSKYCAEKVALKTGSELCSINSMMKNHTTEIDVKVNSLLGFVCPAYDYDMVYAVEELLENLVIKNISDNCYVFAVFTCGDGCGTAEKTMKGLLSKKEINLSAAYKVVMPDNYIPMFPLMSKDKQMKMLNDAGFNEISD